MRAMLDVVADCDNFPYYNQECDLEWSKIWSKIWEFWLPKHQRPHGYMLDSTVEKMPWTASFEVDASKRRVQLLAAREGDLATGCNQAFAALLEEAGRRDLFECLRGPRCERHHVLGAHFDFLIDRDATSLFGVTTRGVHMTVYTRTEHGMKLWIPRRSLTDRTYAGMLDNSVAGGISAGETPLECIVREANEEAALPEDFVRQNARPAGTLSWFSIKDQNAGCDPGLLHPGVQYVYDLEVAETVELIPAEAEHKEFNLWDISKVMDTIRNGEYKPSCAVVIIDFFIRHSILTAENEPDIAEIVSRIHRRLPFLTTEPAIGSTAKYHQNGS